MYVTVVAVMCKLMVETRTIAPSNDCTPEEARIEEIVETTDQDPNMDVFACHIRSQIVVADWKKQHPIYFKDAWRVARVKCAPGKYTPKGEA